MTLVIGAGGLRLTCGISSILRPQKTSELCSKMGRRSADLLALWFQRLSDGYASITSPRKFVASTLSAILEKVDDPGLSLGPFILTTNRMRSLVTQLKWLGAAGAPFNAVKAADSVRSYSRVRLQGDPEVTYTSMIPVRSNIGSFAVSSLSAMNLILKQATGKGLWWAGRVVIPLAVGLNPRGSCINT